MTIIERASPAKLNLHLEILAPRSDGFHELQSVFQQISLADRIRMEIGKPSGGPFECRVHGPFDFPSEKNHAFKAARLFHEKTGIGFSLAVRIDKKIPMEGGLGGGSGNAAVVLSALNAHFGNPLPAGDLARLGAAVGSDVPFFLTGGAALVRGRGEKITPISGREDLCAVLITPRVSINTAEAYSTWDRAHPAPPAEPSIPDSEIIRAFGGTPPGEWPFGNSFFNVLFPSCPVLAEIREILYSEGSDYANLTGSGSCLFGMFTDREKAEKTVGSLESRYPGVQIVAPVETVN
jgi:4-diphosphocytidyl-2-C-methyl-D-erythritol kinase